MGTPTLHASTALPRVGEWLARAKEESSIAGKLWPGSPNWLRSIVLQAAASFARSCRLTLRTRTRPITIVYPQTNEVFQVAASEPHHIVVQETADAAAEEADDADVDFAALIIEKEIFIGFDKRPKQATDYVFCPVSNAKLYSNDVLLHECFNHTKQVVMRLMRSLGPLEWTMPPCTPRVVAAWNKLLRLDDCFIEPHVPSSVELEKMADDANTTAAERIELREAMLFVQRNQLVSPMNRLEHYDIAVQVETDAVNAKKDVRGIKYAPHGVALIVAHGTSDEDVVSCKDAKRVLGRVAAHIFLQLHAHHVRALDVRCNGLVHTGGTRNATSSLILRSLRLCNQVNVLRASTPTLAAVYAASLATTIELCELDIRDYLFIRGKDVGMLAAPYASVYAARKVVASLLLGNATFVERMRQRVETASARGLCPSLEAMCLYAPHRRRRPSQDAIDFATVARLCTRTDLLRFEIYGLPSGDVLLAIIGELRGGGGDTPTAPPVYFNLAVLRLITQFDITEHHFYTMADFLSKWCVPRLEVLALRQNRSFQRWDMFVESRNVNADCTVALVQSLPAGTRVLEMDYVPLIGRAHFIEAVQARQDPLQVFHAPSLHLSRDLSIYPEYVQRMFCAHSECVASQDPRYGLSSMPEEAFSVHAIAQNAPVHAESAPVESRLLLAATAACCGRYVFEDNETLRSLTLCMASAVPNIESADAVPLRKVAYADAEETAAVACQHLFDTLVVDAAGRGIIELKVLYVCEDASVATLERLGVWIANHKSLCSFAYWTHNCQAQELLCEAIMKAGGPPATLVEISLTRFSTTTAAEELIEAVQSNNSEMKRVASAVADFIHYLTSGGRGEGEVATFWVSSWISGFVYLNHPMIVREVKKLCKSGVGSDEAVRGIIRKWYAAHATPLDDAVVQMQAIAVNNAAIFNNDVRSQLRISSWMGIIQSIDFSPGLKRLAKDLAMPVSDADMQYWRLVFEFARGKNAINQALAVAMKKRQETLRNALAATAILLMQEHAFGDFVLGGEAAVAPRVATLQYDEQRGDDCCHCKWMFARPIKYCSSASMQVWEPYQAIL